MPRNGCKECSKRRIICDKGTPQCQKCVKKGIQCTGLGIHYRFAALKTPDSESKARGITNRTDEHATPSPVDEVADGGQDCGQLVLTTQSSFSPTDTPRPGAGQEEQHIEDPAADLCLEIVRPGISRLLDHFSTAIAPFWVVFDGADNGYRNILLPLALQDDLVQRAVCIVSAFHLGQHDVRMRSIAESGRSAIIAKLVANVSSGHAQSVFNWSTWATILVLLVGETVTGSEDFNHLYSMLMALPNDAQALAGISAQAQDFMLQQTKMFELFTPPLLGMEIGTLTLAGNLERYFGFLSSERAFDPALYVHLVTFKNAIILARDIYLEDAGLVPQPAALQVKLNQLRLLTEHLTHESPGMYTLVWAYFIAAASSRDVLDRQYFTGKLCEVHAKTGMKNILVALVALEDIWSKFPDGGWVRSVGSTRAVLVM